MQLNKHSIKRLISKLLNLDNNKIFQNYKLNNYYNNTNKNGKKNYIQETVFTSLSGKKIPVFTDYRYFIKPGWKYYGPLSILEDLRQKNLLEETDINFLNKIVGERTLTMPLNESYNVIKKYQTKYSEMFLMKDIPILAKKLLKPSVKEIEKEIHTKKKHHKSNLDYLVRQGLLDNSKPIKVLEIGYTSGGASVTALERLGFDAYGIDYYFNDSVKPTLRHEYIQKLVGSKVKFFVGDITKQTEFQNDFFDIIYSNSVIEHILDLKNAFKELFRILKKGGLLISSYGSFFFPGGGHSMGILDSPWANVRLPKADYYDYIRKMRPYEADIAIEWIENSLCPQWTISKVQCYLIEAGFSIKIWNNYKILSYQIADLDYDILKDCFETYPNITIEDLITRGSYLVCKKD